RRGPITRMGPRRLTGPRRSGTFGNPVREAVLGERRDSLLAFLTGEELCGERLHLLEGLGHGARRLALEQFLRRGQGGRSSEGERKDVAFDGGVQFVGGNGGVEQTDLSGPSGVEHLAC